MSTKITIHENERAVIRAHQRAGESTADCLARLLSTHDTFVHLTEAAARAEQYLQANYPDELAAWDRIEQRGRR
jgi:hypothetical protein